MGDKLRLEGEMDAVPNNRVNYPEHPVERPSRTSVHKNSGNLSVDKSNPMAADGSVSREGFIFEHLTRNPRFDNVRRRPGYSRGPSGFLPVAIDGMS